MSAGVALIILTYLLITFAIGIYGYRSTTRTAEDYFLANRAMGTVVFFFTTVATHISGFSVFGLTGMAYRTGFAAYEFTFLANIFAPILLYVIGYRIWRLGKSKGYITPTEFFFDRFPSHGLKILILSIWIFFNLPFLAIQWTAAGYTLSGLSNGTIPFATGVVLLTTFTVAYVWLGGMKSVAWTDTFQGILMFVVFTLCGVVIIQNLGGLEFSLDTLYRQHPELFSRPGGDGLVTPRWAVGMILLGLSVFMAPQLFVRFYVPRSVHQFKMLSIIWIPSVSALMFMSVLVGSVGRIAVPGLSGQQSDEVYSMLLADYAPPLLSAVFSGGVLAAFMSTASAVILVLSQLFTRDIYRTYWRPQATQEDQVRVGRMCVLVVGLGSCILALLSGSTIFNLLVYAWSAFSMVLPATIAALYWKRAHPHGCIAGMSAGLLLVVGLGNFLPETWAFGFPPLVPALVVNTILLVGVSLVRSSTGTK